MTSIMQTWSLLANTATKSSDLFRRFCDSAVKETVSGNIQESRSASTAEKKWLVKAKIYPTIEDVPSVVSNTRLQRAKDRMRVRGMVYLSLGVGTICLSVIFYGQYLRRESIKTEIMIDKLDRMEEAARADA